MNTSIKFHFTPTASGNALLVDSYESGVELAESMFKEWGILGDVKLNDIGTTDNNYRITECYIDSGSSDYLYFAIDMNSYYVEVEAHGTDAAGYLDHEGRIVEDITYACEYDNRVEAQDAIDLHTIQYGRNCNIIARIL